ncbi:MAG: hypothetical protein CMG00_05705 [Candidatus Marinimicrobia bacterium]|nr:hypothetical protein [Candidatus Neomarinimicrobiota bacterium]|tara:strand:- start:4339 stop:5823 length:1485 start_codon:yes stop_codon:yes gene_type:complete
MYRYLFAILFLSITFTQSEYRVRQDFNFSDYGSESSNVRNEQQLLDLINSIVVENNIPGLSVTFVKGQDVVWDSYFGFSNIDENIQVDENTMFILSSVSKTITATALMQLWESNLFDINESINNYLPFDVIHPGFLNTPITFKMLLSHTSGISDNWGFMPYYDGDSPIDLQYYLEQYLTTEGDYYDSNLNFTNSEPGTNFEYSNIAVALIGLLIQEISNQPFNDFCRSNIFEPLGMENTYWFLSEIEDLNKVAMPYLIDGASGDSCSEIGCFYVQGNSCFCDPSCLDYQDCCPDYNNVCVENNNDISPFNAYMHYGYSDYPSGQLRSTSKDLSKFMSAYMNDGIQDGVRILNSQTIDYIKTIHYPSANSSQGLIWYYKNQSGRELIGHNGGDTGSLTEMFFSPSNEVGVVLLTNSSSYNALMEIENAVLDFAENFEPIVLGDINSDNTTNIQDVILIIGMILNDQYNQLADINSDSSVDVSDIILVVNIILNIN